MGFLSYPLALLSCQTGVCSNTILPDPPWCCSTHDASSKSGRHLSLSAVRGRYEVRTHVGALEDRS